MSKSHSLTRGNYEFQIYLSVSKISKHLHTLPPQKTTNMQFDNISNNDKRSCEILKLYSMDILMIISLNQRKTDTQSQVRFTTSHELVLKWHNAFLSQVRTLLLACFSRGTYLEGTTVSPLLSTPPMVRSFIAFANTATRISLQSRLLTLTIIQTIYSP